MQHPPDRIGQLLAVLKRDLPDIRVVPLPLDTPCAVDADPLYPSALGLYVNLLATEAAIYLPCYGLPTDAPAQATVRAVASRPVVPIDCGAIAAWGGSLRCLTCQVAEPR